MLIFGILLLAMLVAAIGAAVVGLWAIAVVDVVVVLIVAGGLRVAFPARRAVLTYREIMVRQAEQSGVVEPVEQLVTVEQPVATNRSVPVEQTEELSPMPGALAAA